MNDQAHPNHNPLERVERDSESDYTEYGNYVGPDPGIAAERTDLAWSRSGVSLVACGIIVFRGMPTITGNASEPIAGSILLTIGIGTWLLGRWSAHRRRGHQTRQRPVATWSDLSPAAYGTVAVGVAGLAVIFLGSR
ncbi:MAG: DUF202 domain-containing protein [Actinomycetes bacterium]